MLRKSTTDWLSLDKASRSRTLSSPHDCRCRNVWREAGHPAFDAGPAGVWGSTQAPAGRQLLGGGSTGWLSRARVTCSGCVTGAPITPFSADPQHPILTQMKRTRGPLCPPEASPTTIFAVLFALPVGPVGARPSVCAFPPGVTPSAPTPSIPLTPDQHRD